MWDIVVGGDLDPSYVFRAERPGHRTGQVAVWTLMHNMAQQPQEVFYRTALYSALKFTTVSKMCM